MNETAHWIIDGAITLGVAIVMYLLRRRDDSQQQEIKDVKDQVIDLYTKHVSDVDRLHSLELEVARNIYSKDEINLMIKQQQDHIDSRFDRLEKIMDGIKK